MYCKKCGTKLEDGVCICPQCGTTIQQEDIKRKPINKLTIVIAMVAVVAIVLLITGLFVTRKKDPGYYLKNEWGISHDEVVSKMGDDIFSEKNNRSFGQNPTITGFEKDVLDADGVVVYSFDESGLYRVSWISEKNADNTYAKIPDIVKKYNELFGNPVGEEVFADKCRYRWKTKESNIMVASIVGDNNRRTVMIDYTEINHADK